MSAPGRSAGRRLLVGLGVVLAVYLVVRGVVELFVIDWGDPDSYRADWGGPSLVGVLAVHTGPSILIIVGVIYWLVRRSRRDAADAPPARGPGARG